MDLRVRKALVHSIDRPGMNEGLFEGHSWVPEAFVVNKVPFESELLRSISRYPYNPQRTEQLMNEAGLSKDRDGFYANPAGERFAPDFQVLAGPVFERGQALIADTWRQAGIQVNPLVLSAAAGRSDEVSTAYHGLNVRTKNPTEHELLRLFIAEEVGTPSNRWAGDNRAGWTHPDYERLWTAYNRELDRPAQERIIIQMQKLVSEQLPGVPLWSNPYADAYVSSLVGPTPRSSGVLQTWNIHEWTLR
jgi:ABC-type transport system substrate-binding protein